MRHIKSRFLVFSCCLAAVLCGCLSYTYEGERGTSSHDSAVPVYQNAEAVDFEYKVLGTAEVSGDHLKTSREDLAVKLGREAAAAGADAVLIVSQRVVPDEVQRNVPNYGIPDEGYGNSAGWRNLNRDIDTTYGVVDGFSNDSGTVRSYKRVMRAEFLQRTGNSGSATVEQR